MKERLFAALRDRGIEIREVAYRMIGQDGFNCATCVPEDPHPDFSHDSALAFIDSNAPSRIVSISTRLEATPPRCLFVTFRPEHA